MRKKILCPKCKKPAHCLVEHWTAGITFDTDANGMWDGKDGNKEPGFPEFVRAHCKCGHAWKLKKVLQITDIEAKTKE